LDKKEPVSVASSQKVEDEEEKVAPAISIPEQHLNPDIKFFLYRMHGIRANISNSWRNVLTSERYQIIRGTFPLEDERGVVFPLVDELLESYRCHLKYLRRHTLTALLCCSPIPFNLFERKVSKTVQLDLLPLVEDDVCSGPS
jgi:hypothetical protein